MWNVASKWGTVVIVTLVLGTVILSLFGTAKNGFSTLFSDSYIPVKMFIIEKYPARVIIIGEYRDVAHYATSDVNTTDINTESELVLSSQNNMLKLIDKVLSVPEHNGTFDWDMNFNFNNQFNTKQIRSTQRASQIATPKGE